eukprot:SAG31_NODE_15680_length_743_cov_0.968944_1_plen_20_part_01
MSEPNTRVVTLSAAIEAAVC